MFCVHCGVANSDGSKTCGQCGTVLFRGTHTHSESGDEPGPVAAIPPQSPNLPPSASVSTAKGGINTKQMIVLWYGALTAIGVVLFSLSAFGICVAVLLGTGMAVYTLSHHHNVSKGRVALWVIGPITMICGIGGGLLFYNSKPSIHYSAIMPNSIELFDVHMTLSYSCGEVTGRVRNHSDKTLKLVKLRVTLSDPSGPIDGAEAEILVDVPTGETRSLKGSVCSLREAPGWTWNYSIVEIRGE